MKIHQLLFTLLLAASAVFLQGCFVRSGEVITTAPTISYGIGSGTNLFNKSGDTCEAFLNRKYGLEVTVRAGDGVESYSVTRNNLSLEKYRANRISGAPKSVTFTIEDSIFNSFQPYVYVVTAFDITGNSVQKSFTVFPNNAINVASAFNFSGGINQTLVVSQLETYAFLPGDSLNFNMSYSSRNYLKQVVVKVNNLTLRDYPKGFVLDTKNAVDNFKVGFSGAAGTVVTVRVELTETNNGRDFTIAQEYKLTIGSITTVRDAYIFCQGVLTNDVPSGISQGAFYSVINNRAYNFTDALQSAALIDFTAQGLLASFWGPDGAYMISPNSRPSYNASNFYLGHSVRLGTMPIGYNFENPNFESFKRYTGDTIRAAVVCRPGRTYYFESDRGRRGLFYIREWIQPGVPKSSARSYLRFDVKYINR